VSFDAGPPTRPRAARCARARYTPRLEGRRCAPEGGGPQIPSPGRNGTRSAPRNGRRSGGARGAPRQSVDTARAIAWEVLVRVERDRAFAERALDALLKDTPLDRRDRALATELAYGTLRVRGRLDAALRTVLDKPLEKLERRVANLLRLGAYQILQMKGIPDAAAVSECVRLARAAGLDWASGLVNAVLRQVTRRRDELPEPDRDADPIAFLCDACSLPRWLAERWLSEWGADEAEALARTQLDAPPRTVRLSPGVDPSPVLRRLGGRPCRFAPHGLTELEGDPLRDPGFARGELTPQDEASQLVPLLLGDVHEHTVVDACAAPGTKSVQLAQAVGPKGEVIALDRHAARLRLIHQSAQRLGLANLRILERDAARGFDLQGRLRFARILVDAPCSGLGALRRNPDARWRVEPAEIPRLADEAHKLLLSAARYVDQGGVLVYSVCTLTREETQEVVAKFLEAQPGFRLDDPRPHLPESAHELIGDDGAMVTLPHRHGCDGFYACRLLRDAGEAAH
jgi:16S rRNA (cytosine967-C5)-methyltransferase